MYLKLGKIKIHITFAFAAFIAFAANTDAGERLTVVFVSALLHECIHLCFLIGFGCRDIRLTLHPSGAAIRCTGTELLPVQKNAAVLLSAPLANILLGLILYPAAERFSAEALYTAAFVNLRLGLVNLLPVPFFDGGRSLKLLLEEKCGEERAVRLCRFAGGSSLIFLALFTAVQMLMQRPWGGTAVFTGYCFAVTYGGRVKHIFYSLLKKEKQDGKI